MTDISLSDMTAMTDQRYIGEFNILMDKRHVYDWNTRVPLLVRGPGIQAGAHFAAPAVPPLTKPATFATTS